MNYKKVTRYIIMIIGLIFILISPTLANTVRQLTTYSFVQYTISLSVFGLAIFIFGVIGIDDKK